MLAVGKELLIGRTLDTNSQWIGNRLARMGSMLARVSTVDDDLGEISSSLRDALSRRPDFLVVVGGLGPTPDDMTLRGVGKALGEELRLNRSALAAVRSHYRRRAAAPIELTPARRKMATLPRGGRPVPNGVGTAPGVRLTSGKTVVFCLPGVPAEMERMFERSVEPEIRTKLGPRHRSVVTMAIEGVFESSLAPEIERWLRLSPGAYIKSHPKGVEEGVSKIEMDVATVAADAREARKESDRVAAGISDWVRGSGGKVQRVRTREAAGARTQSS